MAWSSAACCALALAVAACVAGGGAESVWDPCSGGDGVARGDGLAIGLAYVTGTGEDVWTRFGVAHPCSPEGRSELVGRGAKTAVFRPKVDEISTLRTERGEADTLLSSGNAVAAVAYVAGVRSPPRLVRATDPLTFGAAGRVRALTLIVRLDKGRVKYLQWHDVGCGACGGDGPECVAVERTGGVKACVDLDTSCAAGGDKFQDVSACSLGVNVAFSGTDKHSRTLKTGLQITSLNDYSLTKAYSENTEEVDIGDQVNVV